MAKTIKINFEETSFELEINGTCYPLAPRTVEIVEKIEKHDKNLPKMSEAEGYLDILNILLGEKAVKEIFPGGNQENLDRMAHICVVAIETFNSVKNDLELNKLEKQVAPLKEVLSTCEKATKEVKKFENKSSLKKAVKKSLK